MQAGCWNCRGRPHSAVAPLIAFVHEVHVRLPAIVLSLLARRIWLPWSQQMGLPLIQYSSSAACRALCHSARTCPCMVAVKLEHCDVISIGSVPQLVHWSETGAALPAARHQFMNLIDQAVLTCAWGNHPQLHSLQKSPLTQHSWLCYVVCHQASAAQPAARTSLPEMASSAVKGCMPCAGQVRPSVPAAAAQARSACLCPAHAPLHHSAPCAVR